MHLVQVMEVIGEHELKCHFFIILGVHCVEDNINFIMHYFIR